MVTGAVCLFHTAGYRVGLVTDIDSGMGYHRYAKLPT